jgi:ATP-dependent DNA helicase RecQ
MKSFISSLIEKPQFRSTPSIRQGKTNNDFISKPTESGIVYCLSRRRKNLQENLKAGVNAKAYHAGFDTAVRSQTQDDFINDECQVVCADCIWYGNR